MDLHWNSSPSNPPAGDNNTHNGIHAPQGPPNPIVEPVGTTNIQGGTVRGARSRAARTVEQAGPVPDTNPPAYDGINCKQGGRGFCRMGTVFTPVGELVTAGVNYDIARDGRLRQAGQDAPMLPGSAPTEAEIAAIEPVR